MICFVLNICCGFDKTFVPKPSRVNPPLGDPEFDLIFAFDGTKQLANVAQCMCHPNTSCKSTKMVNQPSVRVQSVCALALS